MVLVYFRGHGDWFVDDDQGLPVHLIKAEDRGTYVNAGFSIGYHYYRPCDLIEGVFKLSDSDTKLFKHSGSLTGFKIDRLEPVHENDSAFTKMVDKGLLPIDAFDLCYFKIATNRYKESRLRRQPDLIDKGKLHYDLALYKSITDEAKVIIQSVAAKTAIVKRAPIARNTETLEVIHAALDALESKNGKTPTGTETAGFMLSGEFQHSCIASRTDRQLRLISGNTLDKTKIERIYRRTVYPHPAES